MSVRTLTRSFTGGEVTPEFWGKIDDIKFQTGLAKCLNFIPVPHGPIQNRPGTMFVREVKDSSKKTRLIPFTYSPTQTFAIEIGEAYIRFHTQGSTLLAGSPAAWSNSTTYVEGDLVSFSGLNYYCRSQNTNHQPSSYPSEWYAMPASGVYEIPNPFDEADLADIKYVQSADVLTLVHPYHTPKELRRLGPTQWLLSKISFVSTLLAPVSVTATPTGGTTNPVDNYSYAVAAVGSDGAEGPYTSGAVGSTRNLSNAGAYITITWPAVTGASYYKVYKKSNTENFGYIGQTTSLSFVDNNIVEDLSNTPPSQTNPFATDWPGAVSYFEQRRCFAGTPLKPQNVWLTKSGTESNLSSSVPSRDDDAISFQIAAREASTIRHIVPLNNLILLSSSAEWRLSAANSDVLTPSTVSVRPQSYIGASNVQPVVVNNNLIFASARGGKIRELAYNWQANGYITGDLSIRAPHLFDGLEIMDMDYAKSPHPVVWFVSSNGKLLGLTYVPEQNIGAWHQHNTDGEFESITVVTEGSSDSLYVVVKRTINNQTKRYVERFASRSFASLSNAFFVDSGLTYSGSPATVISGLSHLEGKTVSILADGAVQPRQVVTGGQITLEQSASLVHVGLPYTSDAQTLPLAFETMAFGQGREKNVNTVWLRVYRSSGIFAGPDEANLTEAKQRTNEPYGSPPDIKSEEIRLPISPSWQDSGQVFIRQSDPLPLTIVSMTLEVEIGA